MPSKRRQINVRADEETVERFDRVRVAVTAALGLPVSQAGVIRLALIELERKYPPASPPAPKRKAARGGRAGEAA